MAVFKRTLLILLLSPALHCQVVSLDLCADQWALWALKPEQIAGLSHLAKNPKFSAQSKVAQSFKTHTGDPEHIACLTPTYLLADTYLHPFKKNLFEKLGFKVLILPPLKTHEDIKNRLAFLKEHLPPHVFKESLTLDASPQPTHTAFILSANGALEGKRTPGDLLLNQLGIKNAAPHTGTRQNPLEYILNAPTPVVLIPESTHKHTQFSETVLRAHGKKVCKVPASLMLCPGPWSKKDLEAIKASCVKKESAHD